MNEEWVDAIGTTVNHADLAGSVNLPFPADNRLVALCADEKKRLTYIINNSSLLNPLTAMPRPVFVIQCGTLSLACPCGAVSM